MLRSLIRPLVRDPLRSPFVRRGGWSPIALFSAGEQGVWLDLSDFSTLFQDSAGTTPVTAVGQPLGKVNDKSGRGNHFAQATATCRPLLQQDAGGFWYGSLDGVDDFWSSVATLNLSANDKVTVIAGVRKASDAAGMVIAEHGPSYISSPANDGSYSLSGPSQAGVANFASGARGSAPPAVGMISTAAGYPSPISAVLTASHDIAGDSSVLRVNGVAAVAGVADKGLGNFANLTHYIGARGGTTLPFNGRAYQYIIVGRLLTAAEITLAERFVGSRMGLTL